MKTNESSVELVAAIKKTRRVCPVTGNLPTTISRESFARLCGARRKSTTSFGETENPWCQQCGGKQLPPGLVLTDLKNLQQQREQVMAVDKTAVCALCDQEKSVKLAYGKVVCPTCSVLMGVAKNRPTVVVKALQLFGALVEPDNAKQSADQVASLEAEKARLAVELKQAIDDRYHLTDRVTALKEELQAVRAASAGLGEQLDAVSAERDDLVARLRQYPQEYTDAPPPVPMVTGRVRLITDLAWKMAESMITEQPFTYSLDEVKALRAIAEA